MKYIFNPIKKIMFIATSNYNVNSYELMINTYHVIIITC